MRLGKIRLPPEKSMKAFRLALLGSLALATSVLPAQQDFARHAALAGAGSPDAAIARAVNGIRSTSIEKTVDTLIRFGTRITLSSMEKNLPQDQGISRTPAL
ncbi:MAG TPA: hypothetical protein VF730_05135 [Terracidiphilus sp.]